MTKPVRRYRPKPEPAYEYRAVRLDFKTGEFECDRYTMTVLGLCIALFSLALILTIMHGRLPEAIGGLWAAKKTIITLKKLIFRYIPIQK
jgi:hypothetical protein